MYSPFISDDGKIRGVSFESILFYLPFMLFFFAK